MIREAIEEITDRLTLAGLTHAVDPRDLNLPGILITLKAKHWDTLDADVATIVFDLIAITADTGNALDTLDDLDDLIGVAGAALDDLSPIDEATAGTVLLPNHSPDPLPAITAEITVTITH